MFLPYESLAKHNLESEKIASLIKGIVSNDEVIKEWFDSKAYKDFLKIYTDEIQSLRSNLNYLKKIRFLSIEWIFY